MFLVWYAVPFLPLTCYHRTAICALEADQVARREIAVITFRAKLLRLPSPD